MKDKSKNFETSLPENYVCVKKVDAKSAKKTIAVYTIISLIPILIIVPSMVLIAVNVSGLTFGDISTVKFLAGIWITFFIQWLYIVLHELVHGITYKICTGGKLKFGMTISVAFCGVPDLYVRRKASLLALVMPFLVFDVIFLALTIVMYIVDPFFGILASFLLAMHIGGCVGDLHWTLMYMTKYKGYDTLMKDIGPTQWLYMPSDQAEKGNFPIIKEDEVMISEVVLDI